MSLQLPNKPAPPVSDAWPSMAREGSTSTTTTSSPITSTLSRQRRKSSNNGSSSSNSTSVSVKTRTARPPASPFVVSGKAGGSSPLLPSRSRGVGHPGHHGTQHSLYNASANGHDEIASMTDVRRLEDMLAHNESLLSNANLCSQLPGGTANVEGRNKAMKERLEHLYAMHAINVQMQDRVAIQEEDDNPFMDDEPYASTSDDKVKREDGDRPAKIEEQGLASSPQLSQEGLSQFRSHINGSPPLSSSPPNGSPGSFHRHWKENIANRTTMVGKVGQLSMEESLSLLQTRANHRLRAQAELERLASERGVENHFKKGGITATGDIQTVNANDPEFILPEEEEDYDWHTAGYYHEDEDGA